MNIWIPQVLSIQNRICLLNKKKLKKTIYQMDYQSQKKTCEKYEINLSKAYGLICDYCSQGFQQKIKDKKEFEKEMTN